MSIFNAILCAFQIISIPFLIEQFAKGEVINATVLIAMMTPSVVQSIYRVYASGKLFDFDRDWSEVN